MMFYIHLERFIYPFFKKKKIIKVYNSHCYTTFITDLIDANIRFCLSNYTKLRQNTSDTDVKRCHRNDALKEK